MRLKARKAALLSFIILEPPITNPKRNYMNKRNYMAAFEVGLGFLGLLHRCLELDVVLLSTAMRPRLFHLTHLPVILPSCPQKCAISDIHSLGLRAFGILRFKV